MNPKRLLIAGASGQLGRLIVEEAHHRGYQVRALSRDKARASALQSDLRRLSPVSDPTATPEFVLADVRNSHSLAQVCDEMDVIISALGASVDPAARRGSGSFRDIDYQGNKNLLEEAKRAGVKRFIYVSVFLAPGYDHVEYVRAHEDFVAELKNSSLDYVIVRPTGFFSVLGQMVSMARKGYFLPVFGQGSARTNPIDDQDLAGICIDAIERHEKEINAGGPDILTRRQINELAFQSLNRKPRIFPVPRWIFSIITPLVGLFDRRLRDLFEFIPAVSTSDGIAPKRGSKRLKDHFERLARQEQ